jgi:hypothetical protein
MEWSVWESDGEVLLTYEKPRTFSGWEPFQMLCTCVHNAFEL